MPKVVISGGGTGGHVFPAIAIANAIMKQQQGAELLFVGAKGRMEMEKVPQAGYKIEGLWLSGLQRSLSLKNLSFPFKVLSSLVKAGSILRRFRPDVAVGVGGYASGPLLHTAARRGIPCLIQEQNSYPGITNKLLAKKASKICVAYEGMERFFPKEKLLLTGNPVRQDIAGLQNKKEEALRYFGFTAARPVLLVMGGSLGARTINESVAASLADFRQAGLQLIWQTGKLYYEEMTQQAQPLPGLKIMDFIARMDYAYAAADLVVSRAGAISVSELCLAGKAAILVPSPNVAEDHQTRNAMALVQKQAAVLVADAEARAALGKKVLELSSNSEACARLRQRIKKLARENAADIIAAEVLKLAGK